jgi:hypothetical protein
LSRMYCCVMHNLYRYACTGCSGSLTVLLIFPVDVFLVFA